MSKEETTDVVLWEAKRTDKAVGFFTEDPVESGVETEIVWLPLSQISHISHRNAGNPKESLVTIPCWLAEKKGL